MIPDTYLQTFQYNITHRWTNCSYNLFKWKLNLDWANSAPTYPQTGHHSHNMFSQGIFVMGPLLCDIILRENMINHLYKNLNNSIHKIFIMQSKWYPQTTDTNFAHKNFVQCKLYPQALCPQGNLLPTTI